MTMSVQDITVFARKHFLQELEICLKIGHPLFWTITGTIQLGKCHIYSVKSVYMYNTVWFQLL